MTKLNLSQTSSFPPATRLWSGVFACLMILGFVLDRQGSRLVSGLLIAMFYGIFWTFITYHSPERFLPKMFRWFPLMALVACCLSILSALTSESFDLGSTCAATLFLLSAVYFEVQRRHYQIKIFSFGR